MGGEFTFSEEFEDDGENDNVVYYSAEEMDDNGNVLDQYLGDATQAPTVFSDPAYDPTNDIVSAIGTGVNVDQAIQTNNLNAARIAAGLSPFTAAQILSLNNPTVATPSGVTPPVAGAGNVLSSVVQFAMTPTGLILIGLGIYLMTRDGD